MFIVCLLNLIENDPECRGISVREREYRQLAFVDDVTLLALTRKALLRMLEHLHLFSQQNNLTINYSKTSVIVFKKRNSINKTARWWCGQQLLSTVKKIRYLGYWFSEGGSQSDMMDEIRLKTSQANAAIFNICRLGGISKLDAKMTLWNAMARSIILYSSPVWSWKIFDNLNTLKTVFLKKAIGVPTCTPNALVYLETGQIPLSFDVMRITLNYYMRIFRMDISRTPKFLFDFMSSNGIGCAVDLINCCNQYGQPALGKSTDIQSWAQNLDCLIRNIYDNKLCEVYKEVSERDKLRFYMQLKYDGIVAEYLNNDFSWKKKKMLTQLRLDALPLNGSITAYTDFKLCEMCNNREVETRNHFLFHCPMYQGLREKYLDQTTLHEILSLRHNTNNIFVYITKALEKRREVMSY